MAVIFAPAAGREAHLVAPEPISVADRAAGRWGPPIWADESIPPGEATPDPVPDVHMLYVLYGRNSQ